MATMSSCSLYWDSSKIFGLSNAPRCVHLSRVAEAATSATFVNISFRLPFQDEETKKKNLGDPLASLGKSCVSVVTWDSRAALFDRSSRTFGYQPCLGSFVKPLSAAGSGLEALVTDTDANLIQIKNAKIVVESQEATLMQVRVDLPGEETSIVFDKVLINLGKTAPPVPGFRKQKGGKTSKIPKDFLLRILGEGRVTKFVIQEIITSTLADYVKKENLTVKDNKINTIQTAEELRSLFVRGKEFGFNATLELETATSTLELETATAEPSSTDD